MKLLLIAANRYCQPVPVMPLGVCQAAEAAERAGHAVRVLNLMFASKPLAAVAAEIERFRPEAVGISIRNIDNNDMLRPVKFYRDLPPLIGEIRRRLQAPIILGGAAVGLMPESFLRYTRADYAVVGHAETALPLLLAALARGGRPWGVPQVAWLEAERYITPAPALPFSPELIRVPDFRRWLDLAPYRAHAAAVPVQTKRGCPFSCVYCTYARQEGPEYMLIPPGRVAEQIRELARQGFRDVEFVDNVFNSPYEHAQAVVQELALARLGVRYQSVELNPAFTDGALLAAMEKAGFIGIGITAESAADSVLRGLGKNYTADQVQNAATAVARHGIPCFWIFLLGGPGETEATALQTLRFAAESMRPCDVAFFNLGVRVYPGTEMERIARRQQVFGRPRRHQLEPRFYLSPDVDRNWIAAALARSLQRHMNFLDSSSLRHPIVAPIQRLSTLLGVRMPLWRHTRFLRRSLRFMGIQA